MTASATSAVIRPGLEGERLTALLRAYGQDRIDSFPLGGGDAWELLLSAARGAAARLARPEDAQASGYRRVGPDFPGMGEHWLKLSALMADGIDIERPAIITYTEIAGRMIPVSVAHTVVLTPGASPPELPGVPAGGWHEHAGTVEEEMVHLEEHERGPLEGGTRVSMVHVWTVPNPAGSLAQHNWLLPLPQVGAPAAPIAPK